MKKIFFLYTITFILAACSIIYELLIAQTLSVLSANTVARYTVTIGIYLGSMGLGSMLCNKIYRDEKGWGALLSVEMFLSVFGSLSVLTIYIAHTVYSYSYESQNMQNPLIFFIPAFLITFAIGFFSGLELPLLIRIGNNISGNKKITNRVLGVDYMGSLAGAIIFPLLLLPNLEVVSISFITAFINLLASIAVLYICINETKKPAIKRSLLIIVLMGFLTIGLTNIEDIKQYFLKKYYFYIESSENISTLISSMKNMPDIERFSSPYQKIDIVKSPPYKDPYSTLLTQAYSTKFDDDPNYPRDYYLYLNGDYQISTEYEELYHEYIVHVPIIMNNKIPESVLVLGGGDGLLDRELLKYTGIKKITHVELDRKMLDLAKTHPILSYINKGALDNPRVKIEIADGYQFVKNNKEKYDAIFIDFPYAVDYNLSKLYSKEFYHFVKQRIKKGGFLVIDAPGIDEGLVTENLHSSAGDDTDWSKYYNTLIASGFKKIIPFISKLELENKRVNELYKREAFRNPEFDIRDARYTHLEHIMDTQKGFIMLLNEDREINTEFIDHGIKMHVLNKDRFALSLSVHNSYNDEIDIKKINSIMKPTFPSESFWNIRLP